MLNLRAPNEVWTNEADSSLTESQRRGHLPTHMKAFVDVACKKAYSVLPARLYASKY